MTTFGNTSQGSFSDIAPGGTYLCWFGPFQAPSNGVLQKVGIFVNGAKSNVWLGVYTDDAGTPNVCVGHTPSAVALSDGENQVTVSSGSIVSGSYYWVCTQVITDIYCNHAGTNNFKYKTNTLGEFPTVTSVDGTISGYDASVYVVMGDALAAGTASSTGHGSTTADLTCDAATGGTAPYTYQWYRHTSSPVPIDTDHDVAGATSLTLNDTGLDAETDYYYVCRATDDVAATDDSNEVHVTTDAAQTVTISAPVQYQTYQRNGSNQASIAASGTYTGGTPTHIEARFNGGAWTQVSSESIGGGNWSGTLANQSAGQGAFEVRWSNATGVTASKTYVGIGDVFLAIGNSIAEGALTNTQTQTGTMKATCYKNAWQLANDPTGYTQGAYGSFWPMLASLYNASSPTFPIAFLNVGYSGSKLSVWSAGGSAWADGVSEITESGCGGIKAVLCHVGEVDVWDDEFSQAEFNGWVDDLATLVDSAYSVKLLIACCGMVTSEGQTRAKLDAARAAIIEAWGDNANCLPAPVLYDIDISSAPAGDGIHFKSDAVAQTVANRWWQCLLDAFYSGGGTGRGPQINTVQIDAAKTLIIATFDVDVGPILQASGSDGDTGFRVLDDATPATIDVVAKVSSTVVAVSVTAAISGTATLQLGSGNDGAGNDDPTDSGTYNLPAEPFSEVATAMGGGGYTYGDDDPAQVLTTATGAGTYDVSNVAAGNIRDTVSIGGVTGTFTHTADYTLITGVAAAEDVRDGTPRYSGGGNGSLAVPNPSNVKFGIDTDDTTGTLIGVVDATGTWHAYGTCSSSQAWTAAGIVHTSGTVATYGTLDSAAAYHATGVIYGSGDYATEASRNSTTAGASQILTGYSVTIAGSTTNGTLDLSLYCLIASVVSAAYVVVGHDNRTGGDAGTYPTTATSQAAQLAADQAVVAGYLENIDGGTVILGQTGTGVNATTIRTALGMESADLDTQLADIPTVAEMNARTLVSSGYATPTNITAASGVSLAATGLDAIADPDDLTVGTVPTTFTQKLRWLIQRFWKGTKTATALTVKNEAGSVITTQSVSDDGTTESLNGPA